MDAALTRDMSMSASTPKNWDMDLGMAMAKWVKLWFQLHTVAMATIHSATGDAFSLAVRK